MHDKLFPLKTQDSSLIQNDFNSLVLSFEWASRWNRNINVIIKINTIFLAVLSCTFVYYTVQGVPILSLCRMVFEENPKAWSF